MLLVGFKVAGTAALAQGNRRQRPAGVGLPGRSTDRGDVPPIVQAAGSRLVRQPAPCDMRNELSILLMPGAAQNASAFDSAFEGRPRK